MAGILRKLRRLTRKTQAPTVVTLHDRPALRSRSQAIPPQLFQTTSSRHVNERLHREIERFRDLNPSVSFTLFDDNAMDRYMETAWGDHPILAVYQGARFGQMRADIFRYCIVFDRGGYYCDINKAVFADITNLHSPDSTGVISFERNECIVFPDDISAPILQHPEKIVLQWAFGFIPQHPLLKDVIDSIVTIAHRVNNQVVHNIRDAILMTTGPGVFTRSVRNFVASNPDSNLAQIGMDFNGLGTFRLEGSHRLSHQKNHYTARSEESIFAFSVS